MSEIPLLALQGLAGQISEKIEYWREYEGRTVTIEYVEYFGDEHMIHPTKLTYGVEGTISDVRSLPPGFMLTDAVEFTHSESLDAQPLPEGGAYSQEKGEMFVSFENIERMVFDD